MSPRKSATARAEREPASLPEVPIPLSEVPEHQRSAYEIELIENPEALRAALSTDDFFPMLLGFPQAWWERLSLYCYRLTDDRGVMIRNAPGQKGYLPGGVLHHAIEEEDVARTWGGGKFRIYLKLDSKLTLREHVFYIDAPPKVLSGQTVEIEGKPVPIGTVASQPAEERGDVARVIEASAHASEKTQGLMMDGAKAVIEMVKEQAAASATPPRNALDDVKTLLEIVKVQQAPHSNSMKDALEIVDRLDAMAARRNPAPAEREEKATPIQETLDAVKELTGGVSLAELLKPVSRAAAADPVAGWAPIVSTIGNVVSQFFEKLPVIQAQRIEALKHEIYLRQLADAQRTGQPAPPAPVHAALPAAPPPPPNPPPAAVAPQNPDPAQLMNMLVQHICRGFDKAPVGEWGEQTAAAMDFHFSNAIESLGIAGTLANPEEVDKFVAGVPELAKRSQDARWKKFRFDFVSYCIPRWGDLTEEEEEALIERMAGLDMQPPKPGPQPVAG